MKRVFFLLVGILAFSVACQDDLVEPENDLAPGIKSAKYGKTQTFQIKGWARAIPDLESPMFICTPEELGIEGCSKGWLSGHENILGKIVQEESNYKKLLCDLMMINERPVLYDEMSADILRINGDRTFGTAHIWTDVTNGEIWGDYDFDGGTGRFEGITGTINMLNASYDPDTGVMSWDEEGEITLVLK